ncbi:MAG: glycosyltransferase [Actinomycetota bacterium]
MNALRRALLRHGRRDLLIGIALLVTVVAAGIVARAVDVDLLRQAVDAAAQRPLPIAFALVAFTVAFVVRAVAWTRVLPGLSLGHSLAGIHLALGGNHVLPFRLGEPLRVISVVRRAGISLDVATASTLTLRAADMVAIVLVGIVAAPTAFIGLIGPIAWLITALVVGAAAVGWRWMTALAARRADVRAPGLVEFALAVLAWVLEALLVMEAARWAGIELSWTEAAFVTSVAVVAQIAAIAPGGFGTYEVAAVGAYVVLGHDVDAALVAALGAHGLKTLYSLIVGVIAMVVPAPSFVGRFRLRSAEDRPDPVDSREIAADAPVVLFMPAYNEEDAVADCVQRAPASVLGHPVEVIVVDDGSRDETAVRAERAGATVVPMGANQGLGAAVRRGLAEAVARRPAAVAFCDADGEYPPEELANLIGPILDGSADYVAGSRFLGTIEHMHPHRRFGNIVLTRLLSIVARRRISDGQTGYRAFSPGAAAAAEIIHDFNYAQVITLDLLAKGYVYLEVPISYRFRTTGESFIKLGRYLRAVVPAVYRELNTADAQPHRPPLPQH